MKSAIHFRVYGLPRSGTTWVANWLNTDQIHCWHDPIEWASPIEIEQWARGQSKIAGISCTGSWRWLWGPEIRTIKLVREPAEIQASLKAKGLPQLPEYVFGQFAALPFPEVTLGELTTDIAKALDTWLYLVPGVQPDMTRWKYLSKMNVQPCEAELQRVRTVVRKLNCD